MAAGGDQGQGGETLEDLLRKINDVALQQRDVNLALKRTPASAPESPAAVTVEISEGARSVDEVTDPTQRDLQVDSLLEQIKSVLKCDILGLTLDPQKVSKESLLLENMVNTHTILGSGNTAGRIIKVIDPTTGQESAQKTMMVSFFKMDEIRLWVQLQDVQVAPRLYAFRRKGNDVEMFMEPLEAVTMEDVINNIWRHEPVVSGEEKRNFALVMLYDLLEAYDEVKKCGIAHRDLHTKNFMLEKSMKVKFIDFGSAAKYMTIQDTVHEDVRLDILGLVRIFTGIYSMNTFNSIRDLKLLVQRGDLDSQNELIKDYITEEQRIEMYNIIMMVFETVRDGRKEHFGNTDEVQKLIKEMLNDVNMEDIRTRLAQIIFPDICQTREEDDGVMEADDGDEHEDFVPESCVEHKAALVYDPYNIWNNEKVVECASHMTTKTLQDMGLLWK